MNIDFDTKERKKVSPALETRFVFSKGEVGGKKKSMRENEKNPYLDHHGGGV